MEENKDIGTDELLEWARLNNMSMSEGQAKDMLRDEESIDIDEWLKENSMTPIGEYESLSKRMKSKIQDIIKSLKEDKKIETSDDREEKDTLDEKDGKEELDKDKKKEVKERENKDSKEGEQENKDKTEEEKKQEEVKEKDEEEKPINKDEYLGKVRKLHEMKIREYREEMKKDDVNMDRHFVNMIYLQREVDLERQAYIKEHGMEELSSIENQYMKEELKYQKTLNIRRGKELTKLKELDKKLDAIIDKMQTLQKSLEDKNISVDEYNDEIRALENDKLETLWKINKLNPELLQEKQDRKQERDEYQKNVITKNINRQDSMSKENRAKQQEIEVSEKKQQGIAGDVKNDMSETLKNDINEKEKRLDILREHLKKINIESPEGKKEALTIISEIQTLEAQKMSQENQQKSLDKNMSKGKNSYGDLKAPELERQEDTEDMQELHDSIDPNSLSDGMMEELRNAAIKDPETPEQAEEYLDNLRETAEEADKEKDEKKQQEQDDNEVPTLWNKRKKPF